MVSTNVVMDEPSKKESKEDEGCQSNTTCAKDDESIDEELDELLDGSSLSLAFMFIEF